MAQSSARSNWAIVIGIDEYGSEGMRLSAAVSDALRFLAWVLRPDGGNVPASNVKLLLGLHAEDPRKGKDVVVPTEDVVVPAEDVVVPTKDGIVTAINQVVNEAGEESERLFFFFAGHGLTARVANRDEGALVTPGFDEIHTDHSLAVRSLTEYFETTPFANQFFFIDACRNKPWLDREFEIGRWPIPRSRDPGKPPVQQFILQATSPGLTAMELPWPKDGEAQGAFTDVLMSGLDGEGSAKAWSWERGCYEVRWERLATYVNKVMSERKHPTKPPAGLPADGWPIQIPQDTGSRGVANGDRDAVLASFARERFGTLSLTLDIKAKPVFKDAEVSVLDSLGEPIVRERGVAGTPVKFQLPPRTYAARAVAKDDRVARVTMPIELYEDREVDLLLDDAAAEASGPGTIAVGSSDPLGTADFRDEAGQAVAVTTGNEKLELVAGFYRVRSVGPEELGDEHFVVLSGGERTRVRLDSLTPSPSAHVVELAKSMGGKVGRSGHVIPVKGAKPVNWAQASTIVLAGLGAALHGAGGLRRIELEIPPAIRRADSSGIALYAVAGDGSADSAKALGRVRVRVWPVGETVPAQAEPLQLSDAGVAAYVVHADAVPHWLSIEHEKDETDATVKGKDAIVVALPVLPGRLATLVAQIERDQVRTYQVHPAARPAPSAEPERLREVETLERLLLSGRLDGAPALARKLADEASDDPFAGCLAGYVLLRLGLYSELEELVAAVAEAAPRLSDAHILRGELEAYRERPEAGAQAFMDAVSTGIPAFGEGLTRLLEGLRANSFVHPRGALVRHIFQRHARGSMWAAFTPRRGLEPGQLVITGADLGFEG